MTYGDVIELGDGFHLERQRRRPDRVCPACHVPGKPFYVDSTYCIDCQRTYRRNWARKNRDKLRASRRRQEAKKRAMTEHKDRVLLAYARENPEHFAQVWEQEAL